MSNYYKTYYDKNYILYEPVQYSNDVFSVSFSFCFLKEEKIYPYFKFNLNNKKCKIKIKSYDTKIRKFYNITFGPLQEMIQEFRPIDVNLVIKTKKKIIFCKKHKILNFDNYSYREENIDNSININLMLASCFALPGYRNPPQVELYNKFTETALKENADFVISTGDNVYLEPMNITSETAIQAEYTQLKQYPRLTGMFSNHTWMVCNDDHDFSYRNGCQNSYIIRTLRYSLTKNFPTISQVSTNYRADFRSTKNISFITLDDVSCRILNPEYTSGYNKYLHILGDDQLQFLLNALANVSLNFGDFGLCFIIVGKSMFGEQGGSTFLYCPQEREIILNYIKTINLRNVCFLCGDSHFSDLSEYVANTETNQIIREIRCSPIGSIPRSGDTNQWRIESSLVENINNYGRINISGPSDNYNIIYNNYTIDGIVYTYSWNNNYI